MPGEKSRAVAGPHLSVGREKDQSSCWPSPVGWEGEGAEQLLASPVSLGPSHEAVDVNVPS